MIPNPHKTAFLTFEGIDFSGKSTQFERLKKFLTTNYPDLPVIYTKEPDINRPSGKEIYQILNGEHPIYNINNMEPFHMQAFYMKDRMINYRDNIIPGLQGHSHVLQDRGPASSLCYGSSGAKDFHGFMGMHDLIFSAAAVPLIRSDLTLIFDVPADVAIARGKESGRKMDALEDLGTLTRVRNNYLEFAKQYPNCAVIDGTKDEQTVYQEVLFLISPLLRI